MSDIVKNLRAAHGNPAYPLMARAANELQRQSAEIERLRAENSELKQMVSDMESEGGRR